MRKSAALSYSRNDFKLLKYIDATCGEWKFPRLKKTNFIPLALTPFNQIKGDQDREYKTVHFIMHDYAFERIWKYPYRYLKVLQQYDGVIGPDFSCFIKSNKLQVVNLWNVYRNRVIDNFLQKMGVNVVPMVVWGDITDLEWCLSGISKGSSIAISSLGVMSGYKKEIFIKCFEEVVKRLRPSKVIFIGIVPTELEKYDSLLVRFDTPIASYLKLQKTLQM